MYKTEKFIDPICGMTVSPETAAAALKLEDTHYYFCSKNCLQKFNARLESDSNFVQIGAKEAIVVPHGDMMATPSGNKTDPVCGMTVDHKTSTGIFEHNGRIYYFCSNGCVAKFKQDPESYLQRKDKPSMNLPKDVEYTCPMHPQIVQIGPGACPICGMALEPKVVSSDTPEDTVQPPVFTPVGKLVFLV